MTFRAKGPKGHVPFRANSDKIAKTPRGSERLQKRNPELQKQETAAMPLRPAMGNLSEHRNHCTRNIIY